MGEKPIHISHFRTGVIAVKQLWDNIIIRKNPHDELLRLLSSCFLFQDLSKKEISFIAELVHVRYYKPSEPIFRQGEVGVGMYIIGSGAIDIKVEDTIDEKDISTHVALLKKGDFFGELSLVEPTSRRSATAVATEDAMMVGFFKPDLDEIIERNPSAGAKILFRLSQVLGRRLRGTSDKVTELKKELKKLAEQK